MPRRIGAVIGAGAGAVAAVLLLAGCVSPPDRGDARPRHLPLGVPIQVVADCEASAGLGGSAPVIEIWRESDGVHVRIGPGTQYAVGRQQSPTEKALQSCLTVAAGPQEGYPSDSAGLLLLWKYSTTSLWPCFAEHGVDIGPLPSRSTFLSGDPLQIDPFDLIRTPVSSHLLVQLRAACPPVPEYLKADGSG